MCVKHDERSLASGEVSTEPLCKVLSLKPASYRALSALIGQNKLSAQQVLLICLKCAIPAYGQKR